jgi:hypothetical protein
MCDYGIFVSNNSQNSEKSCAQGIRANNARDYYEKDLGAISGGSYPPP